MIRFHPSNLFHRFNRFMIKRINKNTIPTGATKKLTWNKNKSNKNFNCRLLNIYAKLCNNK